MELAAGGESTCARKSDGSVWCRGDNYYGQLGKAVSGHGPVQITLPTDITQIAVGSMNVCVLLSDATVLCWGNYKVGIRKVRPTAPSARAPRRRR